MEKEASSEGNDQEYSNDQFNKSTSIQGEDHLPDQPSKQPEHQAADAALSKEQHLDQYTPQSREGEVAE